MHELSVAKHILDLVEQYVSREEADRVRAVRMKIGEQAGIVRESLEFGFNILAAESPYRNAFLEIETTPFRIECASCGAITTNEFGIVQCSTCGSMETKALSGYELNITEIELEEPTPEVA